MGDKAKPGDDCEGVRSSMRRQNGFNVVILDTAGRLHVDEDMMRGAAGHQGSSCMSIRQSW